jgi:hypothetical protein
MTTQMEKQAKNLKKGDLFFTVGNSWLCASDAFQDKNGLWKVKLGDYDKSHRVIPCNLNSVYTFKSASEKFICK